MIWLSRLVDLLIYEVLRSSSCPSQAGRATEND
jgi:hypothetical protein